MGFFDFVGDVFGGAADVVSKPFEWAGDIGQGAGQVLSDVTGINEFEQLMSDPLVKDILVPALATWGAFTYGPGALQSLGFGGSGTGAGVGAAAKTKAASSGLAFTPEGLAVNAPGGFAATVPAGAGATVGATGAGGAYKPAMAAYQATQAGKGLGMGSALTRGMGTAGARSIGGGLGLTPKGAAVNMPGAGSTPYAALMTRLGGMGVGGGGAGGVGAKAGMGKWFWPALLGSQAAGMGMEYMGAGEREKARQKSQETMEWTPGMREDLMKGVMGEVGEYISGQRRRVGAGAASRGTGGGAFGRKMEKVERRGREMAAKAKASTYGPSRIPPEYFMSAEGDFMGGAAGTMGQMGGNMMLLAALGLI